MCAVESEASSISAEPAFIGVDVGGTHTDVSVAVGGRVERGKALTTYDDFSRGVLEAVEVAARRHELSLRGLLSTTKLFVNGTTVVTNSITSLEGARVGVILTRGFKDTFRFAGGSRQAVFDDHLQRNVPDLVSRAAIVEVTERVDYAGAELVALDPGEIAEAAWYLVDEQEVEAIAVCFLSSHVNSEHEVLAGKVIAERYPDLFVTLSHKTFPLLGENRRWYTAVLNCFVHDRAAVYLDSLEGELRDAGLEGGLVFVQGLGGGISVKRAREFPLALLGSGPAGGALGAVSMSRRLGLDRVLLGDMGGTSFDTGIVIDHQIALRRNLELDLFDTGVHLVDVVSVGAGGGSIVEVGEREVPNVGPRSATSTPGPASYGRGGTEPTVTDAMVALGMIDPDRYLGGRFRLDPGLAEEALRSMVGDRYGWSTEETACAIHDLVVVNMATAMREISVGKGYDPREFTFLAYGGTLPLFAVQMARHLGIGTVVIPGDSSVFCALGFLSADFVHRVDRAVGWDLDDPSGVESVNEVASSLRAEAVGALRAEGFASEEITVARSADMRFAGQAFELTVPLEDADLLPEDGERLHERFTSLYEQTYGVGTAWKGVPAVLVTLTVTATGHRPQPDFDREELVPNPEPEIRRGLRRVHLPDLRESREIPVYDAPLFTPGSAVSGPAIIDAGDTTIYLPDGSRAIRDEHMNYVITSLEGSREQH